MDDIRQILIVDSDSSAAAVTCYGLAEALGSGAQISVAASVAAASKRCSEGDIDLLIIDPSTRDPSTWALIESVCHQCPATKVLLFTAYGNTSVARRAHGLGVQHYLTKPLDLPELQRAVTSILN